MMKRLLHKLHFPWGLKYKIILLFTAFTLIPLGIVGYYSYSKSIENYRVFLSNYIEQTTEALNVKIKTQLDEAITILNIGTDRRTLGFLNSKGADALYSTAIDMGVLFADIRNINQASADIYDVSIIGANGNCVSERYGYFKLDNDFYSYDSVKTIVDDPREVFFLENPETMHMEPLETNLMTIATGVFRVGTNDLIGIIKVDVRKSSIQNVLADTQWSPNSLVTIVNTQGSPIFRNSIGGFSSQSIEHVLKQNKPIGNTSFLIDKVNYLIVYNTLPTIRWRLLVGVPLEELLSPYYQTGNAILIAILFSFVIILLINTLISNNLVRPITGLKKLMKRASEGDFEVVSTYKGKDEISELYKSFDKMVKKIKQLLETLLQEQDNLKSYELKSLQSQINPHFLYNTLDSVVRVAESGENDEVIDLIIALSHFYRAVLSSGTYIPLSTELKHVENYLIIMKKRYHNILDYSIHVDDNVLSASFPKIILQPIVENAIYHGIKNTRSGGHVSIDIEGTPQNMIDITIKDNGIGMKDEVLNQLMEKINSKYVNANESIGLKNVNERIKLYFGKEYGLKITSQHQVGTTVKIVVPFIEMKDVVEQAQPS